MARTRDLYELLGVPKTATQDEIRKAYLKLAHKHHPDKTGGNKESEEKLKEINAAYDVLKNPEKRAQYDQFGSTDGQPFGGGFGGGFGGFGGGGQGGFDAPFDDLFDMLFGQGRKRGGGPGGAQAGADLEYRLRVTLSEAAHGTKKKISFNRNESCPDCQGMGAAKGSQAETCRQCGGSGQVRAAHGIFSVSRTCPVCSGRGKVIVNPCRSCSGTGQTKNRRELQVDVPPGVDNEQRLRVPGEGEAGRQGGPRGDLYFVIQIDPHPLFQREGTTIVCEVPVTMTQAALGAAVEVPTLFGMESVKVPAGTKTGAQARLRGKGMPDVRGYRQGDQIIVFKVEIPATLSRQQRRLLEEFEREADNKTYPECVEFQKNARESIKPKD